MLKTILGIVFFLVLLTLIPYVWPDSFSEPPVVMIALLAIAAVVAFLVGRRRRTRGWGTDASS